MRGLAVFLITVGIAAGAQTAPGEVKASAEIEAVQQQMLSLRAAELDYDARAAAKLLANDFFLTTTEGGVKTRKEFLQVVGDKSNPLELFEYSEMDIRIYGKAAVVSSRLHEKGFMDGKRYELNARPTWTWVKEKGAWLCVAAHD